MTNLHKAFWHSEDNSIKLSMPIAKVDKERRMVSGFATLDNIDKQSDIVPTDVSIKAFERFRGNLREMHMPIAVGRVMSFKSDKFYDKEEDKFYDYFDKLSTVRKDISPSTPTTVFINMDGTVKDVKIGKISHNEFVKLAKPSLAATSSLDTMSHKEMVKLHNEFHGGGNWKWPGNLKTHLATMHGVK